MRRLNSRPAKSGFEAWLKPQLSDLTNSPLERFLLGRAAFMNTADLWTIALLGGGAVLLAVLCWKEFKLVSFDPDFAASLGYPTRRIDALLTTLVVLAVVIGLQAVGVVLMSALLVAPATAARQWTNRLGLMAILAAGFGAAAGVGGVVLGHVAGANVPTGPVVVLCVSAVVGASLLFGAKRGLAWRAFRVPPGGHAGTVGVAPPA
jgi:manganese/zinc/iron transport system permease protein